MTFRAVKNTKAGSKLFKTSTLCINVYLYIRQFSTLLNLYKNEVEKMRT